METRSTITKVGRSERTIRESLPDGSIRVKTIIEETTPDGRKSIRETTSIESAGSSSGSVSRIDRDPPPLRSSEKPIETSRKWSIGKFKFPSFFGGGGKSEESKKHADSKSTPSSTSTSSDLNSYRQEMLRLHNEKRAKHGSPKLSIDDSLNVTAQNWAETLASSGSFRHNPNTKLGENIFMAYDSTGKIPPDQPVESWYSEIQNYNYDHPSSGCGHFTQVVWKSSQKVGFGCAKSTDGSVYVVANYSPAGNMMGQFKENVTKPIK